MALCMSWPACGPGTTPYSDQQLPFEELPPLAPLSLENEYELPDPLVAADGCEVSDARQWWFGRRPEILNVFESEVYGKTPQTGLPMTSSEFETSEDALGGIASRHQVRLTFDGPDRQHSIDLLLYLPRGVDGRAPIFLTENFFGNHSIHPDTEIAISEQWMEENDDCGVVDNAATEAGRGCRAHRFPVEALLSNGYGLATLYYGDLDPDFDDGFRNGVHPLFVAEDPKVRAADDWGAIGAWAWGLSRSLDYLLTRGDVDPHRVSVVGHSRLGKAALWAGAQDTRFAAVFSNQSGAMGAALSRRAFGETIGFIDARFPHWFADNFEQYRFEEYSLPIDQHSLVALIAPRPVYIASAVEDEWSDPEGEFLSGVYASNVYRLLGREGLAAHELPAVDQPVHSIVGYHIRSGGHDLTSYDWEQFIAFADEHL